MERRSISHDLPLETVVAVRVVVDVIVHREGRRSIQKWRQFHVPSLRRGAGTPTCPIVNPGAALWKERIVCALLHDLPRPLFLAIDLDAMGIVAKFGTVVSAAEPVSGGPGLQPPHLLTRSRCVEMVHNVGVEVGQAVLTFPESLHPAHFPGRRTFDEMELQIEQFLPVPGLQFHAVAEQVHVIGHIVLPSPAILIEVEADAIWRDEAVEFVAIDDLVGCTEVIEGIADDFGHFSRDRVINGVPENGHLNRFTGSEMVADVRHGDPIALHLPRGKAQGSHGLQFEDGSVGDQLEIFAAPKANPRPEGLVESLGLFSRRGGTAQGAPMVDTWTSFRIEILLQGRVGPIEPVVHEQVIPVGVESGRLAVHPRCDGGPVQRLAPDAEVIDPAVVPEVAVA